MRWTTSRSGLFGYSGTFLHPAIIAACIAAIVIALSSDPGAYSEPEQASASQDTLWHDVKDGEILTQRRKQQRLPSNFRTVRLDRKALVKLLRKAPVESASASSNSVEVTLPMPDGTYSRFGILESPIVSPEIAETFPWIKTYSGRGIDDPGTTARFDWTPTGFHAVIHSSRGTVYVYPRTQGDTDNYVAYYKHDFPESKEASDCLLPESEAQLTTQVNRFVNPGEKMNAQFVLGNSLRTYRLAVAATVEYTDIFRQPGDTDDQARARALNAIVTMVNFVSAIYERDLAVRLNLVSGTNVIYTGNASADPYTNGNTDLMRGENQATLDAIILSANYDVGHVFGTNSGGQGFPIGQICVAGEKAKGATGRANPMDPYDVNLVAHEMGHQFGANHTFNGTAPLLNGTPDCGPARVASAAYEPGSGSTIMSYAGGCGVQNLQPNRDDYFHAKSIDEILTYIINGNSIGSGSCAAQSNTGNTPPMVSAGPDFTIPKETPFTLTATASDADSDALAYCWEEFDLGDPSPPDSDSDGNARPILRSYLPASSPSRTFPSLTYILNNANTPPMTYMLSGSTFLVGEALPTITRSMTFRVTVRDNRMGGGGVNTDTMQVNVTSSSGPFAVTQPNALLVWPVGTPQTVMWDVAGTASAPVNCSSVRILLSTDGGNTFPITLSGATPNDGSEIITVPDAQTSQARVKVEAVGNIFFDISDANFRIRAESDIAVTKTGSPVPVLAGGNLTYTITVTNNGPSDAQNVQVDDTVPANTTFVSLNAPSGWITTTPSAGGTGMVTATRLTLSAGSGPQVFTLVVNVNCSAPDLSIITNTATASSDTFDPDSNNNSAVETTPVSNPPPTFPSNCPAPVTALTPISCPPATGAVVTYTNPQATDQNNCPVTVVCNPPSGSVFPVGSTTVTCTATDAANQSVQCSFSVTVFNGCLQDESNSGSVVLFNTFTGEYRFCCKGVVVKEGKGIVDKRLCTFTITHYATDRRVLIRMSFTTKEGVASIQTPVGAILCVITDKNIANNTCNCG